MGAGGTLGTSVGGTVLGNAVNLGTGATLTVGGANNLGLGGAISGGGNLSVNGPATTTLTGAGSYTGSTTIDSGTRSRWARAAACRRAVCSTLPARARRST